MIFITSCGKIEEIQEKEISPSWQEQYDLGMKYLLEENYEEAIVAFTASIEIDPKQAVVYINRGKSYILLEENEENLTAAIADYVQAITLEESNAYGYLGLAEAYIRKNEYEKALEILEEGLVKTGNHQKIADKIAEIESGTIFDLQGKVRKQSGYNEQGELIWYHQFEYYKDGKEKSVTAYNSDNEEMGHIDIIYDSEGRETTTWLYGQTTGILYARDKHYDEEGNIVEIIDYDESGNKKEIQKNIYEEGRLIYTHVYDSEDSYLGYYAYEYNAEGQQIKMSDYLPSDQLVLYQLYEYNEKGDLSEYAEYLYTGELQWKEVFVYDEKGEFIGKELYDGEGNLIQSTENTQ